MYYGNQVLAEPSTLEHFGLLIEFVEIWEWWLDGTLALEVVRLLEHSGDMLQRIRQNLVSQCKPLQQELKRLPFFGHLRPDSDCEVWP